MSCPAARASRVAANCFRIASNALDSVAGLERGLRTGGDGSRGAGDGDAGVASLVGAHSYSSGTTVNGGTLDVDGTTETPTVTLADGTVLNVAGTVQAAVLSAVGRGHPAHRLVWLPGQCRGRGEDGEPRAGPGRGRR